MAAIRDRCAQDLKLALPQLKDVGRHPGRLTPDEVLSISAASPALRVGLWGAVRTDILPTGEIIALPRFAAVFVVRSFDLLESFDLALDLAIKAAAFIANWLPGEADPERDRDAILDLGLPEAVSVEAADDQGLSKQGIAVFGCLFTVRLRTGTALEEPQDIITDIFGAGDDWREIDT